MHRLTVLVLLSLLASGASLLSVAERHEWWSQRLGGGSDGNVYNVLRGLSYSW